MRCDEPVRQFDPWRGTMRRTIGLDIHKRETQACIMTKTGRVVEEKRFPTRRLAFRAELAKYSGSSVVIESVGFHRPVVKWFQELKLEVHVADPTRIPKPAKKTDKKDAKHLANLHRLNALPESYLAPEETQRLRDLARHRMFLGQQAARLKTKVRHDLLKHGHFDIEETGELKRGREALVELGIPEITSTIAMLAPIEDEIRAFQKRLEDYATNDANATLLMTIPGVGAYTASLILAEIGDIKRFEHRDDVGAYAGLTPGKHQSGDTDADLAITKRGNHILRWISVEAARNHTQHCGTSALTLRHKRISKRRGPKKAMVATARNLLAIIHVMLTRHEEFNVKP
jgi:transposase